MLTELTLENFKPFPSKQTAQLAPITLLYGPNSAGNEAGTKGHRDNCY